MEPKVLDAEQVETGEEVTVITDGNGHAAFPRKVAIIGKAPSSALLAPFNKANADGSPEWEIWILNTLGFLNEVPRWDRQYELHDIELTKDPAYGEYYPWLIKQTKPVWTRDGNNGEFQNAHQYPLGEMQNVFGRFVGRKYLTNTVSLIMAHALLEHLQGKTVAEIGLWGIDMAQHGVDVGGNAGLFASEYAKQRPSVEYWCGLCEGSGIKLTIPDQSDILKTACIYGYHTTERAKKFQARQNELRQRINAAQNIERQKHDESIFLSGALEGTYYDSQWLGGGDGANNNA